MGKPDESVWWEDYKKQNPLSAQITEEFLEKHRNDPGFAKEQTERRFSDKTIDEFVDYHFERLPELMKDSKHAPLFQKGTRCGCEGMREDSLS